MERSLDTSTDQAGPGTMLRQAREERRLSVEEVARSLNLSPRHIDSLEHNHYDKLPGPTYVRGYLRGYALLLGLAPERVLEAYNQTPTATQRAEMTAPAPVRETAGDDVLVKAGTIGVAVIVLGLAVLWWSGQEDDQDTAPATSANATVETNAPGDSTPADPVPTSESTASGNAADSVHPEVSRSAAVTPAPTAPTAAADAGAVVAEVPRARLLLRVRADTWADVRDADENRLLYQTIEAGRMVSVQGVPPLSVFLGNVDGVEVEYNGQAYDASRHKRGEVARFTLGVAASN